ncbi:hypothetical protein ACQKPT_20215 [Pseudomonas monteilii]|uniref:hypothetical protein n=1 Tax=Pseudomonas monteilii TaxID=76759 RepID=UPI003D00007A
MSLESQIADLVTEAKGLISTFNSKKAEINAAVAAAIAAIPSNEKSFYINSVTGDDKNPGTAAAPLKSIKQALYNTPAGGLAVCYLQTDYLLDTNVAVSNRAVHVCSDTAGVKRKLRCAYYPTDAGSTWLGGFVMYYGGLVMLTDITLDLPSPAGLTPVPAGTKNAVFMSNSGGGTPMLLVKLSACDVVAAADWVGTLVAAPSSAIAFEVQGTTFPANFGGRYINGVASGVNPATLSNILTNLATL